MRHEIISWSLIWIRPVTLFLAAALIGFSSFTASNERSHRVDNIEPYLRSLPGFWKGEAIETPVGPMSYDVFLHTCSNGTIAGVAKTGASLHYCQFRLRQDTPHLRFLSTFRGNRKPVPGELVVCPKDQPVASLAD